MKTKDKDENAMLTKEQREKAIADSMTFINKKTEDLYLLMKDEEE